MKITLTGKTAINNTITATLEPGYRTADFSIAAAQDDILTIERAQCG